MANLYQQPTSELLFCLLLAMAFWVSGCEKDLPLQKGECFEIPPSDRALGYERTGADLVYGDPSFNPNNPNEIACTRNSSLIKYNLQTHETKKLFNDYFFSDPDWGTINWIYFTAQDYQIWRVQSNGENLMPLTDSAQNFAPDLSPDGRNLVLSSDREYASKRLYVYNIQSKDFQKISFQDIVGMSEPVWSPNGQWIACFANVRAGEDWEAWVVAIDLRQDTFRKVTKNKRESVYDIAWLNSQELIWSSKSGIYKTDWQGNQIRIKKSCDSKRYTTISSYSSGSQILAERSDKKLTGDNTLYSASKIVMMNANGSDERVILPREGD